jgi:hypothetical protein
MRRWRRTAGDSFEVSNASRGSRVSTTGEREYSVTFSVGGISGFSVPWEGTSYEDARDSFLEYLFNHVEFGLDDTEPKRYFRSMMANFNGKTVLVTFRTSWITGFTIG